MTPFALRAAVAELGPLRVRSAVIGAERPANSASPTVILMHGFGAPGTDLVGLADELDAPPGTRFVFPEAPLDLADASVSPGMGFDGDARAWWLIDLERIQRAQMRGETRDLPREIPEGLADARAKVIAMIEALDAADARDAREASPATPPAPLVLGGFSQGAMLAMDVALHVARPLAGVVLLSGTLVAEDVWRPRLASRRGLDVFQSHGTEDPLLPFAIAEQLRDALLGAGMNLAFRAFRGGHTIPGPVMRDLASWLRDRLS